MQVYLATNHLAFASAKQIADTTLVKKRSARETYRRATPQGITNERRSATRSGSNSSPYFLFHNNAVFRVIL